MTDSEVTDVASPNEPDSHAPLGFWVDLRCSNARWIAASAAGLGGEAESAGMSCAGRRGEGQDQDGGEQAGCRVAVVCTQTTALRRGGRECWGRRPGAVVCVQTTATRHPERDGAENSGGHHGWAPRSGAPAAISRK